MRCSLSAMRPNGDEETMCSVQISVPCSIAVGRFGRGRFHFANSANDGADDRWVSVRGIQFHRFVGHVTLNCRGEVCRSGTASHSCFFRINNFLLSDIVCIDALAHHATRKSSYRVCILGMCASTATSFCHSADRYRAACVKHSLTLFIRACSQVSCDQAMRSQCCAAQAASERYINSPHGSGAV